MGFKIFDSHAKDLYMYGRGQPQDTSVLLEVPFLDSLMQFFIQMETNKLEGNSTKYAKVYFTGS